MADLEHDVLKVAKYLYKHKHIVGNPIRLGELRKAVKLSTNDFNLADHHLLSTKYCGGTWGGEAAYRYLKPAGIDWVTTAKKRWSRGDVIALIGIVIAVLIAVATVVVSLTIPEVRKWLGLP